MADAILPTHNLPTQDEKRELPGSYPETDYARPKARRRPKRKSTNLTIDSTAQDNRDIGAEGGVITTSPLSEMNAQSGSPFDVTPRTRTGPKGTAHQRKRKRKRLAPREDQGPWLQIHERLEGHDEELVRAWNEQIDTLLVFAGLFSAVITEFNNEAYQLLIPDPVDESKAILGHISLQLARLPGAIRSGEPIPELQPPPPFQPSRADVAVTTLWYSSLVCALIAASLGMLVKQWLQHYLRDDYSSTRERLRVREMRHRGLHRWHVPAIIAFLPLLLRIALTLFLAGLIVFIHAFHSVVMWTVTGLIITWLLCYSGSLIAPAFLVECPYKAPESLLFYILSRMPYDGWSAPWIRWWRGYLSWCEPEEPVKQDLAEDPNVLRTFDQTFADLGLEAEVRDCCRTMDEQSVMTSVDRILARRLQLKTNNHVLPGPAGQDKAQHGSLTWKATDILINILADTIERVLQDTVTGIGGDLDWLASAISCVTWLLNATLWPSEMPLDKRLAGLLLKLAECTGATEVSLYANQQLSRAYREFLTSLLEVRPSLFRKDLMPLLPSLYKLSGDLFIGNAAVGPTIKVCRAILSIVADDTSALGQDGDFATFVAYWEAAVEFMTLGLSRLPSAERSTVEHDIIRCQTMAENLGHQRLERVCSNLRKALPGGSRQSGSNFAA